MPKPRPAKPIAAAKARGPRPRPGPARGKSLAQALAARIDARKARVGIVGMGYVGLPLALAFAAKGFAVTGFDLDPAKVARLNAGESYIRHIPAAAIAKARQAGLLSASGDPRSLRKADAILICVPTPLTRHREPDLSYIENTAGMLARVLRKGQLIVLESTTYPGTTDEVLAPILAQSGMVPGKDFFLAFSPEREDPGNPDHGTTTIPKVVGGDGEEASRLANLLYGQVVARTVPVSSTRTAEAVKLTENIFRAVNIALVNELKLVYARMGIDIWEVIEAAKTKPFGYMAFYPGPGLGGHCIPIDPFYLTWKAREYEVATRFIELAGEINTAMPRHVVAALAEALDTRARKGLRGARILMLGVAYKRNVDDMRESPSLKLMELLEERGARVDYHDPFIPVIPRTREHPEFAGRRSIRWSARAIAAYDAVLIATDHSAVDYAGLVRAARLVIDTRNATRAVPDRRGVVVKA